ncbi:O-antigen ligase family protein [Nocardioides sp. Kera G14]|uniref:O-antigen ligase family protein n=1 Tax=Nocardioides sp. Kera G14 TaxID=2884264 RepID=UPI001D11DA48|nr:O-antigen ligase family protein [Nocardioides sp. Kera G14]UDY25433.1 hypothetical protein LH076_06435 [Nocardioides sp. Kera G14]
MGIEQPGEEDEGYDLHDVFQPLTSEGYDSVSAGRMTTHRASVSAVTSDPARLMQFTTDRVAVILIVLLWLRLVGNLLVISLTTDKRYADVGEATVSAPAELTSRAFLALFMAIAAAAVIFRMNEIPQVGLWRLALFLTPWLYLLARDAYAGDLGSSAVPMALLVLAMAALRPGRVALETVGVLVVITAVMCLALGLLMPAAGILHEANGAVRQASKALFPSLGLLEGIFTAENNLAQYMALGIPTVLMIRPRWLAFVCLVPVLAALAWSSSRGGLITALAVLSSAGLLWLVLQTLGRRAVSLVSLALTAVSIAVCVWLPLQPWQDDTFTARAGIWRVSVHAWLTRGDLFGFGSTWYDDQATTTTSSLIDAAYHGHNQFVQIGVTGGVVFVFVMAVWLACLQVVSTRDDAPFQITAALTLVAVVVNGFFEVPLAFVDRWAFWTVTLVPMAVLFFAPERRSSHPDAAWRRG